MRGFFRAVGQNRIARWAAIACAINSWFVFTSALRAQAVPHTLTLWPPASVVHAYVDPDTQRAVHYKVENVAASDLRTEAGWPDYRELGGVAAINMCLFAWLVRLAVVAQRQHRTT
jgi:hypothetical protein